MFYFLFVVFMTNFIVFSSDDSAHNDSFKKKFDIFLNENNIDLTKDICKNVLEIYDLTNDDYEEKEDDWDASGDSTVNEYKMKSIDISPSYDISLKNKISSVINTTPFNNKVKSVLEDSEINIGDIDIKKPDEVVLIDFIKKFPEYEVEFINYLKEFLEDDD